MFEAGASVPGFGHTHLRRGACQLLPLMDWSDERGGLSYIKYEQHPSPHNLVYENPLHNREEVCVTWAWASYVFVEPGQTWTSCEFGVGVHQGDWHATADRFRHWLQGWWKPCDTPPAVREKIGLFHIQTHGFSGEPYHEFSEMPAVARDAMKYGVRDLMIWDNTASVYYRPDRGDFWEMPPARRRELKQALAAVRKLGCSVTSFVNWRLLAERNRTWKELAPLAQKSIFGVDVFGFPCGTMDGGNQRDPGYEMGTHAACCGADGYLPYARRILKRTMDLGFDVISMDQGSEWNYCLSREHGHASPWEAWARTYDWYAEATRTTRNRNHHAYTLAEIPDLYNTQRIDVWWKWLWGWQNPWNNHPMLRYVLPSAIPCVCIEENQRDVLAQAFAMGCFMAIAVRDMTGRLSEAPELAAQVKRLACLRKATAPFVSHGQFLDNRGLTVDGGRGYVFSSARGFAVTLANDRSKKASLQVTLAPAALDAKIGSKCILFVEGEEPRRITPCRRGDRWLFRIALPAFGAGVLTLE